jgi:alpha-galactosidase
MKVFFLLIFWMTGFFTEPSSQAGRISLQPQPVSVRLLAFNVRTSSNANILEWRTTSESNMREFIVESSSDGGLFTSVAWITPKGSMHGPTFYRYTDTAAKAQVWYRLRMVEANGKDEVSKVISVNR